MGSLAAHTLHQLDAADKAIERLANERNQLAQALHDIRTILGFDNDCAPTPAAQIADAKSIEQYIQWVLRDVREVVTQQRFYRE